MVPGVELAMKSANVSSGRSVDGNILDPNQRVLSGNVEGLEMTTSSGIHSRTDLNMIDETRGNITVEEGYLVVNEKTLTNNHTLITAAHYYSLLFTIRKKTRFPNVQTKTFVIFQC